MAPTNQQSYTNQRYLDVEPWHDKGMGWRAFSLFVILVLFLMLKAICDRFPLPWQLRMIYITFE